MYRKHLFSLSITLIVVMLFSALGPTTVYADDTSPPDAPAAETSDTGGGAEEEGEAEVQSDETDQGQAEEVVTEEEATAEAGDSGTVEEEAVTEDTTEGQAEEIITEEETTAEADDSGTVEEEAVTEDTSEGQAEEAVTEEEPAAEAGDSEPASEEAVTEDTGDGVAEETAIEEDATEEPSLMEQVPDDTEVVVINAEGETEPLATEEAAAIVVAGDPVWCPDTAPGPTPGENGCTDPGVGNVNYDPTSLESLLNYLSTNQPGVAGTIWIEGSYDSGVNDPTATEFNLDSTVFNTMKDYALTIQGGWDGNSGGTITGISTFTVPIIIGSETNPWSGAVTIQNISISQVQGDTPALAVYSGGDVTVEDSEVNDNGSNNWNVVDGEGLEIRSGGFVTLNSVLANDNQIFGADIRAINGGVLSGVAIADSTFNGNLMNSSEIADPPNAFFGYGLTVVSQGDIALSGVEANGNFLYGAWLDGSNVAIENSTFNMNVSNSDLYVDDTGLVIRTPGNATLDEVEANDNRLIGADIQANGQVTIANSSFSRNYGVTTDAFGVETYWGCGLQVGGLQAGVQVGDVQDCNPQSTSALLITLASVVADNNYFFGADLFSSGDVSIAGVSSFSNDAVINVGFPQEQLEGLKIQSGGDAILSNVTANSNQSSGAEILADGDIRINDSSFFNNQNGNGLSANSTGGDIYLDNVVASSNIVDGAYLETDNGYVCITGGEYITNGQYNAQIVNSIYDITPTIDNIFTSGSTPGNCPEVTINVPGEQTSPLPYTVTPLTQSQLPGDLGTGNTFASAFQISGTATNLEISFPIPVGMESMDLVVMFWDGSGWIEVPGGSVAGGEFVITVTQPGIYVLVAQPRT
jgi:hypothetical protein